MKLLTATFLFGAFILVKSSHRQNHFGNPCYLCECFVEYTDRDQALASVPYKIALNGYDTTEDQCLATCLRDEVK
uniref:Uncharacterized protein n=1 Tax=Panagrolaimus sp. ES5 TaxID=591445 RepID=A0AC34GUB3_9BILA